MGTQSSALINHLPPGHYRFHVTACNSHGVWNHTGAVLGFYVAPFFQQTWIFYGLCAGTLLLGVAAFETYRHRVQQQILALEKHAALGRERERIARDLHDDLGASLSRIARLREAATKALQDHPQAAPHLGRISSIASQVVDSISELVWATNPKYDNLESLAAYFREYAAQFFDSTGIDCRLSFPSNLPDQPLTADFRRQLFLVFKEALQNIAKHAQAITVGITLSLDHSHLDLIIRDDGKGLPSDPIPAFHHGLSNMRERIAALNGALEIHSEPGQGTCVSLGVPLPNGNRPDDKVP